MITKDHKALIILVIVVVIAYFPVTLLGFTYNTSLNHARSPILDFSRDYGCTKGCMGPFNFTIDPGADGDTIWPLMETAVQQYVKGIIPLWDPYLAAGTPLAADTVTFAFSPLAIFYLLPNSLWDIQLLFFVWLAGTFTYLLLRSWNLGTISSLSGSIFFMFSGAITWYLPHNSIPVIIFTPLILYSIEKVFQSKEFKFVILGSVALASAILGAHLESITLLLIVCVAYFIFKISCTIFSKYELAYNAGTNQNSIVKDNRKIVIKTVLIFFIGFALASFFILPALEYYILDAVGRDNTAGLASNPAFTIATTFIPYLIGPIHVYASPATNFMWSWNTLGGYVVASSLLFSLVGITFSHKLFNSSLNKYVAQFFFGFAIFFILKSIGIPVINSIGLLPILDHIVFPRYDGFMWTLGLGISAAFGVEVILRQKILKKHLLILTCIALFAIILMSLLIIPYFTWKNLAGYYMIFQILQGLFFVVATLVIILAYRKNNLNPIVIFLLIFLEASLYIPLGLHPLWQFYRSIAIICGVTILCIISFIPVEKIFFGRNGSKIKLITVLTVVSFTIIAQGVVYSQSTQGLMLRHQAFESTQLSEFLQNNIGYSRIFSLDGAFVPDHPAAFQIQTLGITSANNVIWYNSFFHKLLDPFSIQTMLDYISGWRDVKAIPLDVQFKTNEKYYDFLGVKYIVAFNSNPNKEQTEFMGDNWQPIDSNTNVSQTFVPQVNNITSISIELGTYDRINHGNITLTVNSIPYDQKYYRVSSIKKEDVANGGFNEFSFQPIENLDGKKLTLTLSDKYGVSNNVIAVAIHDKNSQNPTLSYFNDLLKGNMSVDGTVEDDATVFTVQSYSKFPLVFSSNGLNVYENTNVYPRTFLVNKFQTTDSYQDAQNILNNSNFDLRKEVVLENNLSQEQIESLNSSNLYGSTANITSYAANKVTINVNATGDSLLILTDTYYPGWKAFVDGKETPIYRADGLVRAVFVTAGNHKVEFSYMPRSFEVGIIISLAAGGTLAGFYTYSRRINEIKK